MRAIELITESISGTDMLQIYKATHHGADSNPQMERWIERHDWGIKMLHPEQIPDENDPVYFNDPFGRVQDLDPERVRYYRIKLRNRAPVKPIIKGPGRSIIDGNHRAQAAKQLNMSIQAYVPMNVVSEGRQGVAEGKQEYKLNLESIEKQFGEIKLRGGIVAGNQQLIRFLAEHNIPLAVFDHLVEQKIGQVMKDKTLTESIDKKDKNLNQIFSQFNNFATGNNVKVGDSVSVLNLDALSLSTNTIELTGFLEPQTITDIEHGYVKFESGEIFPKQTIIQTRMWRQVIFFHDIKQAKQCLTAMALLIGTNGDWKFSMNVKKEGRSEQGVAENFADGKVKGRSRPGRVHRAGASCKGSVTALRAKAKKYGGEKGKMFHWCSNMKAGKKR